MVDNKEGLDEIKKQKEAAISLLEEKKINPVGHFLRKWRDNIDVEKVAKTTLLTGPIYFALAAGGSVFLEGVEALTAGSMAFATTAVHGMVIHPLVEITEIGLDSKKHLREADEYNREIERAKERVSEMFNDIRNGKDPKEAVEELYRKEMADLVATEGKGANTESSAILKGEITQGEEPVATDYSNTASIPSPSPKIDSSTAALETNLVTSITATDKMNSSSNAGQAEDKSPSWVERTSKEIITGEHRLA